MNPPFKKSFTSKSPLKKNGGKQKPLSYRELEKQSTKVHWDSLKKDLAARDKYLEKYNRAKARENDARFRKSQYPQSGAIEITSGPETFFAAPGAKAGGFVLKKGADLIKSKVAKGAKNLGKSIGGAYAETYLGL